MINLKNLAKINSLLILLFLTSCHSPEVIPEASKVGVEKNGDTLILHFGRKKVTIDEIEQNHTTYDSTLGDKPIAFGSLNKEWIEFKNKIKPGDELFEFLNPPPPGIPHPLGGIELVRNGKIVAVLITVS